MELSASIHLLGDLLGQVLKAQESPALFEIEERVRELAKARRAGDAAANLQLAKQVAELDNEQARAVAAAFALYFDLVNLAEEHHRVSVLRDRQSKKYPGPISGSTEDAVTQLKAQGVTKKQMEDLLENLAIELVFTAHPTQAKRRTILSNLAPISGLNLFEGLCKNPHLDDFSVLECGRHNIYYNFRNRLIFFIDDYS